MPVVTVYKKIMLCSTAMMLCHKGLLNTGNVNFPSGWKVLDPQIPQRLPQCGSPFPDPVKVYEIIWGYMQAAVFA